MQSVFGVGAMDPVFACGISVAPVTSWLLYDSAYTERYMGLLTNKTMENYQTSAIMNDVDHMHGKKFLLIHGTADGMYQM
ncbi:hypothetical protein BLA29_012785 [Euroglyphus maynei]|uniref:Peptidase S9 prolyl oligopeptidase catalytic domain-containing protein n=1 Tax=Euroglyphus maynei TaxID=6958 RepID=A0A1Y3B7A5_EURMA|nr:hypothetical protein BLA29_012785 [Euroglyphus maynei]